MEQGVSNIKIARDEAMSVHQLNETCTFLLLKTLKKIFFSHIYLFSDKITRDCSGRHVNFRSIKLLKYIPGRFIANVIFIVEIATSKAIESPNDPLLYTKF